MVALKSSVITAGAAVGVTRVRTGENAAASSRATSGRRRSSGCRAAVAASPRRLRQVRRERDARLRRLRREPQRTDDATDADGGVDVAEPQGQLLLLLGDQRLLQLLGDRAGRLVAGDASGRRRRRRRCAGRAGRARSIWRLAASARSSHSATRSLGSSSSAILTTGLLGHGGAVLRPRASRSPPSRGHERPTCPAGRISAIGRCSSGRSASTALRWALPGRSRFGFGRCGSSGGGVEVRALGDARRRERPLPEPRSPLAGRSPPPRPLAPHDRRRGHRHRRPPSRGRSPLGRTPIALVAVLLDAVTAVTLGAGLDHRLRTASRSGRSSSTFASSRALSRAVHDRQHRDAVELCSISTFSTSPTADPAGSRRHRARPSGLRAPAARQVHEPSGSALVSSMSIRAGHGATTVPVYGAENSTRVVRSQPVPSAHAHLRARRSRPHHRSDGLRPSRRRHHRRGHASAPESSIWPGAVLRGDGGRSDRRAGRASRTTACSTRRRNGTPWSVTTA